MSEWSGYSAKGCQNGVGIVQKGVTREWVLWERVSQWSGYSGKGCHKGVGIVGKGVTKEWV